ncbi:MAG: GNAT family N-acetyltransferase [Chloroflexi bacterium]|nr:GNAT family N-acetyltransferase [Chloroflexota bacterium]
MVLIHEVKPGLRARTVESEGGLLHLREAWDSLNARCCDGTVFSTWEWCCTVRKLYGSTSQVFVIVVEDGSDVVGIAPLVIDRKGLLRAVRFMGAQSPGLSVSDYCSFVIAPGREETALRMFLEALLERSREWDVLDLQEVPADSCLMASWLDEVDRRALHFSAERLNTSYPVPLPDTWQSYLERLSPNTRSELERKTRKLTREHNVQFERVGEAAQLSDRMNTLFALHTERWTSRGLPGIFTNERLRPFHLEVASRFLEKGWLDLTIITADGEAIGAIYNFEYRDTTCYYISGFRSTKEWSRYSLGSILLGNSIKRAIDKGVKVFDLLRGNDPYKSRFDPQQKTNYRLIVSKTRSTHGLYLEVTKLRGKLKALTGSLRSIGHKVR